MGGNRLGLPILAPPPFLSFGGGKGKEREREKERGAAPPPLVQFGLPMGGGSTLIRPFCIMLLYQYLLHYGLLLHVMTQYLRLFSLILQGLHEEGECRQVEFWPEKGAKLRYLFCATPNAVKINEDFFRDL